MDTNQSGGRGQVCQSCGTEMMTPRRVTNPATSGAKDVVDDVPFCPNSECVDYPGRPEPWRRG